MSSQRNRRTPWIWGGAVVVAAAIVAGTVGIVSAGASDGRQSASSSSTSSSSHPGAAGHVQAPVPAQSSPSQVGVTVTHVAIPAIGVSSDIELLSLDPTTGELLPPTAFDKAGWYQGGVVPGQVGPAIIAGHIDSSTGPAVFVNLDKVQPGTKILVTLSTGKTLTFEADKSEMSLKTQFPSSDVYGSVPTPQLRLITCTGVFNPSIGHYNENLVVFATLVTS